MNLKEFESRVTDAVKELNKPGGVGVSRLKRYFTEKFPDYHVEVKTYLLINALERLAGQDFDDSKTCLLLTKLEGLHDLLPTACSLRSFLGYQT